MANGVTNYMRNIRPPAPEHITEHTGLNRAQKRRAARAMRYSLRARYGDVLKLAAEKRRREQGA